MTQFSLDARLASDSIWIADQDGFTIRLFNDSRYVWVIIVPMQAGIVELHDLSPDNHNRLMALARRLGERLHAHLDADKINTAAIGNIVSQLHLHIVVRHANDPAWPAPVWGHSPAAPLTDQHRDERIALIRQILTEQA